MRPLAQVTGAGLSKIHVPGTPEAVCLILRPTLDPELPDTLHLLKGAAVEVKSIETSYARNPLYLGPFVRISLAATGTHLSVKLECFAGKGVNRPMSVEAFMKLFGGKFKLSAERATRDDA